MKKVQLQVSSRKEVGSSVAGRLRKQGIVPAVLYGKGKKPYSLQVNRRELEQVLHTKAGENVVLSLSIDAGKKEETVLVRDIQQDPVTDIIRHVDFHMISLTEKIHIKVPISTKGEAIGTKEGGVLDHVRREVEVECLPTEIPEKIVVTVDNLKIGDSVLVKDLTFPAGVACLLGPEEPVLVCLAPKQEVAALPGDESGPLEPEVITKKKEDVEGEAEAKPAKGEAQAPKEKEKAK
jgi:large subunit ribosomal protein L25